jgi:hypothetical protein
LKIAPGEFSIPANAIEKFVNRSHAKSPFLSQEPFI